MKKLLILSALVATFATSVIADVRIPDTPKPTPSQKPKPVKSIDTELSIKLDKNAKDARLIIPKSSLQALRAELDALEGIDSGNTASISRTQTIVSGVFLSLAIVFGGVWFARSRNTELKPNKTLVAGALIFSFGAFATVAIANIGPPQDARRISGKMFAPSVHLYKQAWGKIKLETSDKENNVVLIVPDPADEKTGE